MVSMVSMVSKQFPWFVYCVSGFHGFHGFVLIGFVRGSMVCMVSMRFPMVLYGVSGFYGFYSILRLRFPWFPLTLYMFSVVFFWFVCSFHGLYNFCFLVSTVIWVHFIFIDIHRHLCLCASFLVRIAGGGAAPSLLHPPTLF